MVTKCLDKQPPCQELQKEISKLLPFLPFVFGWSYDQNYEVLMNMMMMMVVIKAIPPFPPGLLLSIWKLSSCVNRFKSNQLRCGHLKMLPGQIKF